MISEIVVTDPGKMIDNLYLDKDGPDYHLIAFNNDYTSMEAVVSFLIQILKYDLSMAVNIMSTIHTKGSSVVYTGSYEECETYQVKLAFLIGVLSEIKLAEEFQ